MARAKPSRGSHHVTSDGSLSQGDRRRRDMIVVLMLLSRGRAGTIIRWSIGGKTFSRLKKAGGSFLSSNDPRELIGAGQARIDWVEVQWPAPSHRVDRITSPVMDRYLKVTEGGGT